MTTDLLGMTATSRVNRFVLDEIELAALLGFAAPKSVNTPTDGSQRTRQPDRASNTGVLEDSGERLIAEAFQTVVRIMSRNHIDDSKLTIGEQKINK